MQNRAIHICSFRFQQATVDHIDRFYDEFGTWQVDDQEGNHFMVDIKFAK